MTTKKKDKILVAFILVCALLPSANYFDQIIGVFVAFLAGFILKESTNV